MLEKLNIAHGHIPNYFLKFEPVANEYMKICMVEIALGHLPRQVLKRLSQLTKYTWIFCCICQTVFVVNMVSVSVFFFKFNFLFGKVMKYEVQVSIKTTINKYYFTQYKQM